MNPRNTPLNHTSRPITSHQMPRRPDLTRPLESKPRRHRIPKRIDINLQSVLEIALETPAFETLVLQA
ncbi:hypothetical protein BJY04DRAFT_203645 [Aspergillus karnatakaensis]|uniref:uncharacterized protein n=1 Tax=Aspergillus karnatakaensis TaxID=1810916 RepID=UPI003CCCAB3A